MSTPLRVLIVEDSEEDALLILRELKRSGYDPVHERVETSEGMKLALTRQTWDIILADYSMPHFSGLVALTILKGSGLDTPFILVSGSIGEDTAVAAMKAGANDYMMKNNLKRLVPAIEQEIREANVRRKLKEAEEAMRQSELRYRTVARLSSDFSYSCIHTGEKGYAVDWITNAFFPLTGVSEAELHEQRCWLTLSHPEDRETAMEPLRGLRPGESDTREFRIVTKEGQVLTIVNHLECEADIEAPGGLRVYGAVQDITDRRRAEEALRESEETARALVNATNDSVFLIDTAGNVLALNEITAKRLGKRADEILGSYLYDLLPLDVAQRRKKRLDEVFRTGKPAYFEDERQGIWFDTCGYPIFDATGKVTKLAIYGRDITERKRMEEELRENEKAAKRLAQENKVIAEIGRVISSTLKIENVYERFAEEVRKVIPFDRIVIDLVNADGNNATIRYIAGIETPSRRIGDTFLLDGSITGEIVHTRSPLLIQGEEIAKISKRYPDGLLSIKAGIQSFMGIPLISKDQVIGVLHFRSLKPNAYTESDLRLAESIGAQIAGAVANAQLFSERMRAEEALVTSEERYRTLFEGAAEGILVANIADKQFKYANPAICRMLGYTMEELTRVGVADIHPKEALDHVMAEFNAQTRGEKTLAIEIPCLRKDGSILYVSIATTPVVIDGRKCNVGFFTDITEHKKTEEALKQTEEQLRQSQKMEAIGQLAGGIAHDFNNLLTIIKGYSQLSLLGFKEGDPLRGNLEEIKNAADRAAGLTYQLLAFSRRQILDHKVLDLNIVLRNLEKMLHRVIGEDIELMMHLPEGLGRVKTDPGQIEQIVVNLSVNAKDAMPDGGKLTIETANMVLDEEYARKHVAVAPGRFVMLSVSDTGMGMTPEIKEKVFEPFFTTKKKGEGTGLGLSTVYGIVKQSGGNIWVYSELGKGTTIKIYLPFVEEPLDEIRKKEVVGEGLLRGSETIFVVEDEEVVRNLVIRILKELGYRVLEAAQGVDVFPVADEHEGPIHLLLTDVVMPKISGRELAERLASLRPGIKVLYMSGYTDNAIAHHGILDKGMNFIQKPFTVEGLARKVREVLDK